jgi:hypothetical protein
MADTDKVFERILAADKITAPPVEATSETVTAACDCAHHKEGYALGIQHATEEMQSRAPVAAPLAPTAPRTTVDEAMEAFTKWMGRQSEYYQFEPECLEALRAALVPGDKVHGLFAYTCVIEHADGTRVEFQRRPSKKK